MVKFVRMNPDRFEIAAILREIGQLLEATQENPFRIRAYERGALALEGLEDDFATLLAEGRLTEIPGIGATLASQIEEIAASGRSSLLDKLREQVPKGFAELLRVPDLGPKKIAALHAALGVDDVASLKAAAEAGRVRTVKGFGPKFEQKLLANLEALAERVDRLVLADALELAEQALAHIRRHPSVVRAEVAGSVRRFKELVADIDLVVASTDPDAVGEHVVAWPHVRHVLGRGPTKTSVRTSRGVQIDVRAVAPEDYATTLHHFTGSRAHHVALRGRARERGLTLSEYGLLGLYDGEKRVCATEAELYAHLGLPFIPPELREGEGEIEAAEAGETFDDLVTEADVRGFVHCHTTWSDGVASIEDMARAAEALGAGYITITDHTGNAPYANGLDLDRLRRQWDEIDAVQERVSIRILRGTESDILKDGALDWPDDVLERLDVVIASVHQRYKLDPDAMTERIVRAMSHPVFKIWGHPLGRLVGDRPPFQVDMERVLDAIAASRAAIEINGDPKRMDLAAEWIPLARARGIPFVISVDAHSPDAFRYLRYGVGTARRGGIRRGEVLNARPVDAFRRAVRPAA